MNPVGTPSKTDAETSAAALITELEESRALGSRKPGLDPLLVGRASGTVKEMRQCGRVSYFIP